MAKETNLQAHLVTGTNFAVNVNEAHTVQIDTPEYPGAPTAGPNPIQVLLSALAGCSGISMIGILHKMRQDVTAYTINIHALQAEEGTPVLTEVTVEHNFTGRALEERSIRRALELTEDSYCSVSVMLSKAVQITHKIVLTEAV